MAQKAPLLTGEVEPCALLLRREINFPPSCDFTHRSIANERVLGSVALRGSQAP